jgi:hypothetical protein
MIMRYDGMEKDLETGLGIYIKKIRGNGYG